MRYKVTGKQHNTDRCFVCGMLNDAGVKAEFYNCTNDAGEPVLITKIQPKDIHMSYPNRMHGGVISALLDESIGRAVQITNPEIWAVTIDLNVKFRKPVPLDQTIYIESRITSVGTRAFDGEATMFVQHGTPLATATARFLRVPFDEAFKGEKLNDQNWFIVPEKLPTHIDI